MKRIFLVLTIAASFLSLMQSCKKKDKCADVSCLTGQICVNGFCTTPSTNLGVSGFIVEDTEWTSDNIYELVGKVVVRDGATLTIQPGTIIMGQERTGANASVLIIEKGAKIEAIGTASSPIIFTSVYDDILPGQIAGSNLPETANELWGGLVILGNAPVSTEDGNTQGQIEGIPANETFGAYGGSDPLDNSGTLRYVSIRHGGITIGDGNEINGLTLGGVGSGTTIDHVEVVANFDDGIEFFGGTVNVNDAIVVYQGDDGIDIDQNYSGTINNVVVVTGDGIGTDEAIEIDGPEGSTHTDGLFTIMNGSFINEGTDGSAGDLKSKAQGFIMNSTFEGFTSGLKIRASFADINACTSKSDAFAYLVDNSPKLQLNNNEISSNETLADYVTVYTGSCTDCDCVSNAIQDAADAIISNSGNVLVGSFTTGADKSEFANWTWASVKGKI